MVMKLFKKTGSILIISTETFIQHDIYHLLLYWNII